MTKFVIPSRERGIFLDPETHVNLKITTTHHVLSAETQASGVTVFGRTHDTTAHLHVRSFAPILGVPEDPVCGSGNASVAAYLVHTGVIREIGSDYMARQGMAIGRAGQVAVRVSGNDIRIGGSAITCIDSRLRIR